MLSKRQRRQLQAAYNKQKEVMLEFKGIYYHWTHDKLAGLKGQPVQAKWLKRKYDDKFTMGGGFYVSKNPHEWQEYGDRLYVVEIHEPIRALDLHQLRQATDYKIRIPDLIEELGGIEQIRCDGFSLVYHTKSYIGEWNLINHEAFTVRLPSALDFMHLFEESVEALVESLPWVAMEKYVTKNPAYRQNRGKAIVIAREKLNTLMREKELSNAFFESLIKSFEFIDFHHLLHLFAVVSEPTYKFTSRFLSQEFSPANGLHLSASPWNRYGIGQLELWQSALSWGQQQYASIQLSASGSSGDQSDQLFELLCGLNRILINHSECIRERDIYGGGAVSRSGVPVEDGGRTLDGDFPFRASLEDVNALAKNPFLLRRTYIDLSHSPGDTVPPHAPYLIRYHYPHIKHYDELIQNEIFREYLSEDYRKSFEAELEQLDQKNIEKVNALNKRFLTHLTKRVLADKNISELTRYQYLISIHLFRDGNGRSFRSFYQIVTGKPFFMRNWNKDIFCDEQDLVREYSIFRTIKIAFIQELHEATQEGRAAKFYNVPLLWYAMTDRTLAIFENLQPPASVNFTKTVKKIRLSMQLCEGFIEKQLPYDVEQRFEQEVFAIHAADAHGVNPHRQAESSASSSNQGFDRTSGLLGSVSANDDSNAFVFAYPATTSISSLMTDIGYFRRFQLRESESSEGSHPTLGSTSSTT